VSRRTLLSSGAAGLGIVLTGSAAAVFGCSAPDGAAQAGGTGRRTQHQRDLGYGRLLHDPAGRLALPAGFSYTVVAQAGVTRSESGELTPEAPDGTASFVRAGGGSVLVNNHEVRPGFVHGVPHLPGLVYDPGTFAGTTTIEVDRHGDRVREYVSLAGTLVNCAGGKTPWRTWLSCEETDLVPASGNSLQRRHGYVFEVDPHDQDANRHPKPITALGRFEHEAAAVDPQTGHIYETEDATNPHGLFYRWTPPVAALPLGRGSLRDLSPKAGSLHALRARTAKGTVVADLCVATRPGTTYDVEWVPVRDRDATRTPVRRQFDGRWTDGTRRVRDTGAPLVTRSRKLEGAWWGDGGVYFVASFARTADGSAVQHDGQVWFLDPRAHTIRLVLRFGYSPRNQNSAPDGPDTITVSPYGGVLIGEDGEGRQHLVGATAGGDTYYVARNELGDSEMTGATFSPDKKTLFANIYSPGHVFAITGPWQQF
jgi:secreted PhoX family phosphatase